MLQVAAGDAVLVVPDLPRRAAGHDPAAGFPAAGAHIDDIVGVVDHVQIVLNDDNGRAAVQQGLENAQQHPHIQRMQADRRLVKYKDGIRLALPDLAGQFQALGFAAGQAGSLLSQRQVAQPQLLQNRTVSD